MSEGRSDEKGLDSGYVIKAEPKGFLGGLGGDQPEHPERSARYQTSLAFFLMVLTGLQSIVNQSFWS